MKYDSIEKLNSIQRYIMQMRPVFRKQALFTDETSDYRFPQDVKENDMVTIRFRTGADNVDREIGRASCRERV